MTFEFDDQQINMIVNALAQRPYAEVYEMMNNIQRQVMSAKQPQLQAVNPPVQQDFVGSAAAP
jgi:hypothetical protein